MFKCVFDVIEVTNGLLVKPPDLFGLVLRSTGFVLSLLLGCPGTEVDGSIVIGSMGLVIYNLYL